MTTPLAGPAPSPADPVGAVLAPRVVRGMLAGQHAIATVLIVVGTVRAITQGVAAGAGLTAGTVLAIAYAVGSRLDLAPGRAGRARSWLLALTLVWAAAVAVSAEFAWFAFLLWLLAGKLLPTAWSVLYAAAVLVVVVAAPILHDGAVSWPGVIGPAIGGVFALGISRGYLRLLHEAAERERLLADLARAQRETVDLQDELALAQRRAGQVAERTRLARDVHDTVAQSLSSIRLLAHAGIDRTADEDAGCTLGQVEALAGEGVADVRRIIAALTPTELEDQALPAALRGLLDRLVEQTGISVSLHVDPTLPELDTVTEVALLRVAQSALANVRLHARAHRVAVSLIDDGDRVRLDVRDDGIGFDVAAAATAAPRTASTGYGLGFMRARLRSLGGDLEIESAPGDGTAVAAHLPLHPETTED